jgi:hypothetical protein
LPEVMDARRVTELLPEHGSHGVHAGGRHRGSGVVVQINALHGYFDGSTL